MLNDLDYVLISEEQIKEKVKELGKVLSDKFREKNPLMICVLKGSIPFYSDLVMSMDIPLEFDCISISSYGNKTTSGEVRLVKDIDKTIEGRDVIIVEDIIDTGKTLKYLKNLLSARNPASISIVTLLDKPALRVTDVVADYKLFEIEDVFVVGYGLDFAEKYRNLPCVGVLKKEMYSK